VNTIAQRRGLRCRRSECRRLVPWP
jgi:hypothetical protein